MKKNDIVELYIDAMSSEGSGIGRYDGMTVFVPLTAIGDSIKARIVKVKTSYAYGIIEEILTPSSDRIMPDCKSFKQCGGCVYRHISYESECKIKQNKVYNAVKRIGGVDMLPRPIISAENTERYRNKAQYPVADTGDCGFYATHSHRIIPTSDCLLEPKEFKAATNFLKKFINDNKIRVYDEKTGKGIIRHFYMRCGSLTGELMAVLVINSDSFKFEKELVNGLLEVLGENLKSVYLNINKADTNVILGKECRLLYGKEYITDILAGVKVRISPLSFYQVNRTMAEKLYNKAIEYVEPDGKNILDLYCGAGTIGLSMAKRAKSVIGVEIVPEAIKDAKINASENGVDNARFICADAKSAAKMLAQEGIKPDVVIVDPPRKGCDSEVISTIANDFKPESIVYVSCDAATFARDLKLFCELGYKLVEYTPVDLFPRTSHVECVSLLCKDTQ
ncbi:MAG: 23S rRNA (uracil(1939)-C(5))-methyltransferase RlmD [Ruminococcaceae bacterium]|nr:23S rRNA (uracil(1939)-C(5))-methyltransferase RlmD [Oscillospiraceae bacterium]